MRALSSALVASRGMGLTLVVLAGWLLASGTAQAGTLVTINTNMGSIQVDLFNEVTPISVNNFVNLLTAGRYSNTIFHRSVNNFVIQGGGFDTNYQAIPNNGTIALEHKLKNTRGTLAMARSTSPNTATSQWFINTSDNSQGLGAGGFSPDGYAVFGWVLSGMNVVDAIAALPIYEFGSPFGELPLRNYTQSDYTGGVTPTTAHQVIVNSITIAQQHPSYQNPVWNVDVNNSGTVTAADAMSIVNSMLTHGRNFEANASKIGDTYKYFDTNGDGRVTTSDLMAVVNAILRGDTAPASPLAMPMADPFTASSLAIVPEPSSIALAVLAGTALLGAGVHRRRARRAAAAR